MTRAPGARAVRRAGLLAFAAALAGAATAAGELTVSDARIRALIPGQDRTAAYFEIHNPGPEAITLVGAESPAAGAIEIHQVVRRGELLGMRREPQVVVAPASSVRFEPGGRHLMLFRVAALDDAVPVVLLLADGRRVPVTFRRIPLGAP